MKKPEEFVTIFGTCQHIYEHIEDSASRSFSKERITAEVKWIMCD